MKFWLSITSATLCLMFQLGCASNSKGSTKSAPAAAKKESGKPVCGWTETGKWECDSPNSSTDDEADEE
ncbi:MAG: hypothetical protein AB7F86_08545 [Bdellovibrionales bacterium]